MFADIQPADVYAQVVAQQEQIRALQEQIRALETIVHQMRFTLWLIGILVTIQIFAKFAIFSRVIGLLRQAIANEGRTERLLTLVEAHGNTTDKKAVSIEDSARQIAKTAPAIQAATAEVVAKVEEVPRKVVEEIKRDAGAQTGD